MFAYAMYMVFTRDWCSTHATFSCFLACTHFMKMHSYTQINKKYREQYLHSKKSAVLKSKTTTKDFLDEGNKQFKSTADTDSDSESTPNSKNENPYPHNINIKNFTLFMWMPTLLYQSYYPRSARVRYWYVIAKSAMTLVCILAAYAICTDYVMPVIH